MLLVATRTSLVLLRLPGICSPALTGVALVALAGRLNGSRVRSVTGAALAVLARVARNVVVALGASARANAGWPVRLVAVLTGTLVRPARGQLVTLGARLLDARNRESVRLVA